MEKSVLFLYKEELHVINSLIEQKPDKLKINILSHISYYLDIYDPLLRIRQGKSKKAHIK